MEKFGAKIVDRDSDFITLDINSNKQTFSLLAYLAFTSDRRRMAVVVQSNEGGPIYLFVKGADSTLMPKVRKDDAEMVQRTAEHLQTCAEEGSRTLVMASKIIPQEYYDSWAPTYQAASVAISKRMKKIEACFEELEVDLTIVGASAIQDQLQV